MALYVLGYTYHRQRNYSRLYKLLADWGAKRILDSTWFANLNGSAVAVLNALKAVGDSDDAFFVVELKPDSDWATTKGVYQQGADWLSANL